MYNPISEFNEELEAFRRRGMSTTVSKQLALPIIVHEIKLGGPTDEEWSTKTWQENMATCRDAFLDFYAAFDAQLEGARALAEEQFGDNKHV